MIHFSNVNFLKNVEFTSIKAFFKPNSIYNLSTSVIQEMGAHLALTLLLSRACNKKEVKQFKAKSIRAALISSCAVIFNNAFNIKILNSVADDIRAYMLSETQLRYLSSYIHELGHAVGLTLTIKNLNVFIELKNDDAKTYFLLKKFKCIGLYFPKIPRLTPFGKRIGWWKTISVITASGPVMDYFKSSLQMIFSVSLQNSFPFLSKVLLVNSISDIARSIRRVFDIKHKRDYSRMSYSMGIPRGYFGILHVAIPIIAGISLGCFKKNLSFLHLIKSELFVTLWAISKIYSASKTYHDYISFTKKGFFKRAILSL